MTQPTLRDGDVVLRPTPAPDHEAVDDEVTGFDVVRAGVLAGTVGVRGDGGGTGQLTWSLHTDHRGRGTGLTAVRLVVAHAFAELGLWRVEAYVEPTDLQSLRLAGRAGLRREGLVRGRGVLLARLADDPPPTSPEGFRAVLNAGLPTKRVIAQGLLRDRDERVLLCELTYKPDWDLPGGVVEPDESPRACVHREVAEELGLDLPPGELLTVDWLPPWAGWDDACLLTFDLGQADADVVTRMRLEPREIAAVHWADDDVVRRHCRPQVAERLALLTNGDRPPPFLHSGRPPT